MAKGVWVSGWCGVVGIVLATAAWGTVLHAQERVNLPPLSQDAIDRFRDSLKNDIPLEGIPPRRSQEGDRSLDGVWSGSKTTVIASIGEVILRFKPKTEELLARSVTSANSESALLDSFDVKVVSKGRDIIFTHDNSSDPRQLGGVAAHSKIPPGPTVVALVKGKRESTMYAAVPPFKDQKSLWGLYLCPRVIRYESVGRTGTQAVFLSPSPYELAEVSVSVSSTASAYYEAPRGRVRGTTYFQISPGIPESTEVRDEMIATIAEPKITYRPKGPFGFSPFSPERSFQQGITAVVELQNRAGHMRRESFSEVLSIARSLEPSPVEVLVDEVKPSGDAGECYFLQGQKYSWREYDRTAVSF